MDNNGFVKEKKQPVLTVAGVLAVIAGLFLVYIGFFILIDANNSISPNLLPEERKVLKYLSIGGIYLMVNGVLNLIYGFYGAVNSGIEECMKKISKYGWTLLALSALDVILLSLLTDIAGNRFNTIIIVVSITISAMYCAGAMLNAGMIKKRQEGEDR